MLIYLLNILLIFMWAFLLLKYKPSEGKKKAFCAIACIQWVMVSGFRSAYVGADTMNYRRLFYLVENTSWNKIFNNILFYIRGGEIIDPGYALFVKLFQVFSTNYQVYLIFIALVFMVPMAIWIYKNSSMPCLSFVIFSTLFYSFYAVTGIRQTVATAFVVFIGYELIKKKKTISFLIVVFISFFIHKSCVCFLPFLFFAHKKITWRYVGIFTVITSAFLALGKALYGPFAELIGYDVEKESLEDTSSYVIVVCLIMLASFIFMKYIKNNVDEDKFRAIYNAALFATAFTLLTIRNQAFMRVQQYYTLFLMLLVPELVKAFNKRVQPIVYISGVGVLILKLVLNNPFYEFFWVNTLTNIGNISG